MLISREELTNLHTLFTSTYCGENLKEKLRKNIQSLSHTKKELEALSERMQPEKMLTNLFPVAEYAYLRLATRERLYNAHSKALEAVTDHLEWNYKVLQEWEQLSGFGYVDLMLAREGDWLYVGVYTPVDENGIECARVLKEQLEWVDNHSHETIINHLLEIEMECNSAETKISISGDRHTYTEGKSDTQIKLSGWELAAICLSTAVISSILTHTFFM